MNDHVSAVCKAANFQIHRISSIRTYLSEDAAKQLIHAFVTSRLDYCNSLLYGIPDSSLQRIQRIQNIAARIITRSKKFDHITPVLKSLHWLPIHLRIQFKILLLCYRIQNEMAPGYLCDLLKPYHQERTLRSSTKFLLHVPKTKLKRYGDRAFSSVAPVLWNNLPADIKDSATLPSFKKSLKTYLFGKF
jgi:hypothetical protein